MINYELVVIGASWGGLHAVTRILEALPADTDTAVVVAQHRGRTNVEPGLATFLDGRSRLPVEDADDKQPIEPGHVYLAPPDYHLLIERGSFALSTEAHVHHARPSIDVLFESAADAYGDRVVGVILTGANADGAAGLRRVKQAGGVAVVQNPGTAERHEMPDAALALTAADAVLELDEIGPFLYGLVCEPAREARS